MKQQNKLFSLLFALIGFSLAIYFILGLDTFIWDEAHHAFFGTRIFHDLKAMNIQQFFVDTGEQGWFQPFHSYLDAFFMLLFGASHTAVRLSSAFMYLLTFLGIYKVSMLISKDKGWRISAVACFLLAFSPKMLVLASLNLQEMMGACLIIFILFFYLSQKENIYKYLAVGSFLSVAFLSKYHFGVLLGGTIFLIELSKIFDVKDKLVGSKKFIINNLLILSGFIPLAALWFLTPNSQRKIALLFFRIQDSRGWNRGFNLAQRAWFYVQSILTEYSLSILVGIFIIASVFYCLRYFRDIKVRALIILVFVFYVFHINTPAIFERLIAPAMPAVFILTAIAAIDFFDILPATARGLVLGLVAIILLGDIAYLPVYTKQVANYSLPSFAYRQNIQDISPRILFGTVKVSRAFVPYNSSLENYPGFKSVPHSKLSDILDFFYTNSEKGKSLSTMISLIDLCPYEFYFYFADWGAPIFTMNDYNMQGRYFWFSEYYFAIDIASDSPYKAEIAENPEHWVTASAPFIQRGWLSLYATKDFPDIGIKAKVYKMKLPF
jgi:4-amino-4-deoxy-L-arabinose transferase-like glycosyltransferase